MDYIDEWNEKVAITFIDHCKERFGWGDLSSDVIMDLGCGEEGYCARAILDKFPQVGTIIAIDKNWEKIFTFELIAEEKIQCEIGDIEERESLQSYEGQVTKVFSTQVFHQLKNKEEGFRNTYNLLKPGGEAGILFCIKCGIHDWLTKLLSNPIWREAYRVPFYQNWYEDGCGAIYYKEMLERIGFQVIESSDKRIPCPYTSSRYSKESLYEMWGPVFDVPPEMLEEFKEDCFQLLPRVVGTNGEEKPCYRSTFLTLLLIKPKESSSSTTKENSVS